MACSDILVLEEAAGHGSREPHERGFHLRVADLGDDLQLRGTALGEAGGEVGGEGHEACDLLFLDGPDRLLVRHFSKVDKVVLRQQLDNLAAYPILLLGGDCDRETLVSGVQVPQRQGEAEYEDEREEQGKTEAEPVLEERPRVLGRYEQ